MKRVGLKYCGGCNPAYDRVDLVRRIQGVAGERVAWVRLEGSGCDSVLLINGCERACAETLGWTGQGRKIVSVRHDTLLPHEIITLLIGVVNDDD